MLCFYNTVLQGTKKEQDRLLHSTSTLYIGNLSFYTTEEQITELFSKCGDLKRVIMGLDKVKRVNHRPTFFVFLKTFVQTPCGFCFVEYYTRDSAANAMRWVNGTRLDDRIIRSDWDCGFIGMWLLLYLMYFINKLKRDANMGGGKQGDRFETSIALTTTLAEVVMASEMSKHIHGNGTIFSLLENY